jgi:hypothetical protein
VNTLLFSRRYAQECLDRLGAVVTQHELKKFVDSLNRPGRDRIIRLWEVVILDALSRVSPIQHEQPLSDGQQPDFSFVVPVGETFIDVIGDITCISDSGLDDQNPVQRLSDEVVRVARKLGVDPSKLDVRVKGNTVGPYRDAKMMLGLPAKGGIVALVKTEVLPFLSAIRRNPEQASSMSVQRPDATLTIAYNPGQMFFRMGHPSYEVSYSVDRNPLWAGLKRKADQLRASSPDSIRLVIVCDGDCKTLKEKSPMGGHFSTKAIVEDFLRRTSTVDAVLLLPVVETHHVLQKSAVAMEAHFHTRKTGSRPIMSQLTEVALRAHLNAFLDNMPRPRLSAPNAVNWCEKQGFTFGLHGGYTISGNTMKISSRQVLEALAGIPSHGLNPLEAPADAPLPPPNWQEHFLRFLQRGQMISKVTVVPGEDDDDVLEFEFGAPDVVISPFRMPQNTADKKNG